MIVGEVKKSIPRMRTVKPREKIKLASIKSGSTTDKAKEPVEEEEEEEEEEESEVNSCATEKDTENRSMEDTSVELVEQTLDTSDSHTGLPLKKATGTKNRLNPNSVLPPLTQPKPAPGFCDHQETKTSFAPRPPISLFEQTTTISSNFTTKSFGDDADSRPWIHNPLFSRSRSAEFRLPDISLSSLDALLQTVTQKLARKRRGGDEGPWRRFQSDHLLVAVNERRQREKMVQEQTDRCTDEGNRDNTYVCEAAAETSAHEHSAKDQMNLPPLFSTLKPTLILTMTKKTS